MTEPGAAFRAEAQRLSQVVAAAGPASFARPSPCPPWTVGELFCHVRVAVGRVPSALAEPEPVAGPADLVSAAGYYRDDHRFSAQENANRIALARQGAASVGPASVGPASLDPASLDLARVGAARVGPASPEALVRDFDLAWQRAWSLARAAPPGRIIRTRHGDCMLLTEFLRTRVVELAVHGLDLAVGLGTGPWLTPAAAAVVEDLLLPAPAGAGLRRDLGWDQATLIAKATGRLPVAATEAELLSERGIRWLAFG